MHPAARNAIIGAGILGALVAGGATASFAASAANSATTQSDTSTTDSDTTDQSTDDQSTDDQSTDDQSTDDQGKRPDLDPSKGGHQANGKTEELLTGEVATKVTEAALAAVPGATIERVETDAEGAAYEAHLVTSDGTHQTVTFDADYNVVEIQDGPGAGGGAGPGGMRSGHGPRGGAPGEGRNGTAPADGDGTTSTTAGS